MQAHLANKLGGYWEWVWGPVGDARPGVGYMHRPSSFPLVQFANETGETLCRNIEWPGRHVAKSIHLAQSAYAKDHNGVPPCHALLCCPGRARFRFRLGLT